LYEARLARPQGFNCVGEALDGFREAFFEEAGACRGDSAKVRRDGGRRQDKDEGNDREEDSSDCRRNQHVIGVCNVEAEDVERDVLKRLDVTEGGQSEQGEKHRERCEYDESDIEAAVEFDAGTAADAIGEVLLVVFPHLGRDS